MRFLADMGISMTVVQTLRELEYDAVHLQEQGQPISTLKVNSDCESMLFNWIYHLAVSSNGKTLLGAAIGFLKSLENLVGFQSD